MTPPNGLDGATAAPYRMTSLELATGMLYGRAEQPPQMPRAPAGMSGRMALEAAILPALRHPPCVVSFSGGRDSSAVLAVATHVARREGLDLPVPVSLTFPNYPESDESEWQSLVIDHLALPDWHRLSFEDELDVIGPVAQGVLLKHGVVWPFNSHFHIPVNELASGGCVLTGFGGDELFGNWTWHRLNQVLGMKRRPRRSDVRSFIAAYGPRRLRRQVLERRLPPPPSRPWLHRDTQERLEAIALDQVVREHVRWDNAVRDSWWTTRYLHVADSTLKLLAASSGARLTNPLCDGQFLDAVARERGRLGFPSRTDAMRELFGDVLPERVLARSSKAPLAKAFANRHLASFASVWDGSGLGPEVTDPDLLRAMWSGQTDLDGRTLALAQAAWLSQVGEHGSAPKGDSL